MTRFRARNRPTAFPTKNALPAKPKNKQGADATLFNPATTGPCEACGRHPHQPCGWTEWRATGDTDPHHQPAWARSRKRPNNCNQQPDPAHDPFPQGY